MRKNAIWVLLTLLFVAIVPRTAWAREARDAMSPIEDRDYRVLRTTDQEVVVKIESGVNVDPVAFAALFETDMFSARQKNPLGTLPTCKRKGDGSRVPRLQRREERASDAFWETCRVSEGLETKQVYFLPGEELRMPRGMKSLTPDEVKAVAKAVVDCDDAACLAEVANQARQKVGQKPIQSSVDVASTRVPTSIPDPTIQAILAEYHRMHARLLSLRAARASFDNTVAIVVSLAALLFFALVLLGLRLAHVTRAHDALVLENVSFRTQSRDETEAWGKYLASLEEALDLLPAEEGVDRKKRLTQYLNILKNQVHLSLVGMNELLRSLGAETVKAPQVQVPLGALARAVLALRKRLGSLAGHDPDQIDGYTPSFEQIAAVLADRERLVREERAQLVSNHEAVVLERDAAHTQFNNLQQVVDEALRRAKQFAKAAQEWVGADVCSVPTELAQVPQVIQSINAWLSSERTAEERFRGDLTRLCGGDEEEEEVLDRVALLRALKERIDLHDGNLNALAMAERRLLARSVVGWSGEPGTDPDSLQDLVRAAQLFARDARRFEREVAQAIQGGATALHVDLDEAQPLKDQLKHVLAAAITAVAPKSPATLAQEFMDACGHRVHDELTALRLLLGYDFGAGNGAAPDSNKTGVQSLRDNPGVARTFARWVMADFSGPNDPSISTAVAAQ